MVESAVSALLREADTRAPSPLWVAASRNIFGPCEVAMLELLDECGAEKWDAVAKSLALANSARLLPFDELGLLKPCAGEACGRGCLSRQLVEHEHWFLKTRALALWWTQQTLRTYDSSPRGAPDFDGLDDESSETFKEDAPASTMGMGPPHGTSVLPRSSLDDGLERRDAFGTVPPRSLVDALERRDAFVAAVADRLRAPDVTGQCGCCEAAVHWLTATSGEYWRAKRFRDNEAPSSCFLQTG